jgi:hypothetical protein
MNIFENHNFVISIFNISEIILNRIYNFIEKYVSNVKGMSE